MLVEPRPLTISLAFLACLYLGFFLKSQSKDDDHVSDLRESLHHYVSNVLPWVSNEYETSRPPAQIELEDEESALLMETTKTQETAAAAATGDDEAAAPETRPHKSPSHSTSPAISDDDDLLSSLHVELPHLQKLCRETEWTPNLWLHCHSGCGASKNDFCGGLSMSS